MSKCMWAIVVLFPVLTATCPCGAEAGTKVQALIKQLSSKDLKVRRQAVGSLAKMGKAAESAVPALARATRDADANVRLQAVYALDRIRLKESITVPALIKALTDDSRSVRKYAAEAIARIGPRAKTAVEPLKKALKDRDLYVQAAAVVALVALGHAAEATSAVPALRQGAKGRGYSGKYSAHALSTLEAAVGKLPDAGSGKTPKPPVLPPLPKSYKITTQRLCPFNGEVQSMSFSADRRHFAFIVEKGRTMQAVIDGKAGPAFAMLKTPFFFSPDGTRVAYVAYRRATGSVRMVLDGRPGPEYASIFTSWGRHAADDMRPVFSGDSKRFAYVARPVGKGQVDAVVIIDGKVHGPYTEGVGRPVFSADSKHVAYRTYAGLLSRGGAVVLDGKMGPPFRTKMFGPVAAPAGGSIAYAGNSEGLGGSGVTMDGRMVVNGRPGRTYHGVYSPVFSPDGQRLAYVAGTDRGYKKLVVVSGKPGPTYETIAGPVFSPDSKHVAYVGSSKKLGKCWLVLDGKPGLPHDGSAEGEYPIFSADSKHTAFVAVHGKQSIIVDDKVVAEVAAGLRGLCFSPDGKRVACAASQGRGKAFVVVDGKSGPCYADTAGDPVFSADSTSVAYVAKKLGNFGWLVINGKRGPERFGLSNIIVSPVGNRFACVGGLPSSMSREWGIDIDGAMVRTKTMGGITAKPRVLFSPDGRRAAYAYHCREAYMEIEGCKTAQVYDQIFGDSVFFHPNGVLEYLAVKKGTLFRIQVTPQT